MIRAYPESQNGHVPNSVGESDSSKMQVDNDFSQNGQGEQISVVNERINTSRIFRKSGP